MNYDEECYYLYAKALENKINKTNKKLNNKELLEIFPEAKEIIIKKITELENEKRLQKNIINNKLLFIKKITNNDFAFWFLKKWIECSDGKKLKEINRNLIRLKNQTWINSSRFTNASHLSQNHIDSALNIPLKDMAEKYISLKKTGKLYIGLCPFHNEKTPSFYIYPNTNSFFCYGCQKGGNIIIFIELIEGCSFKKAVNLLLNNKN